MRCPVQVPIPLFVMLPLALLFNTVSVTEAGSAGTAAAPSARATVSTWLHAWPMDRHDPQRTSLSPGVGPTQPHLVSQFVHFYGQLIASDSSIIGTVRTSLDVAMAALSPTGKLSKLSTAVSGASGIRRNDSVLQVGADNSRAAAVSATGKLLWTQSSIGLPKSAAPLVTTDGRFFIAAEGHPQDGTAGLYIVSPHGKVVHHLARGQPIFDVALGLDGSVYTLMDDWTTGVSYAVAYSPDLQEQWRYRLGTSLEESPCDCLLVASSGLLYVGNGNTLLTLDRHGRLAWSIQKPDGLLNMAERADGSILLAGARTLTAISSQGESLWDADIHIHHTIGANDFMAAPTLAVDNAGTAYVGTADGQIVVIDGSGRNSARVPAGGYRYGPTPGVMLAPNRTLVVAGTDSRVRLYR
jgi:outer membrane protein assembly factor BamB